MTLYDMHCHLDFMGDAAGAAHQAAARGIGCFSVTVTPQDYMRISPALDSCANVRVGLGLHPWWLVDGRCGVDDVELFGELAHTATFIGEVGLDFGKQRADSRDMQIAAFERVIGACCEGGGKVISIHAVNAADTVLDILAHHGATGGNACVFHWFSGSSDQLHRAIGLGCYFSIGPRMIASKRGREYAKAIPRDRLLLETDAPSEPGSTMGYDAVADMLLQTAGRIEKLLGKAALDHAAETSERLLFGTLS